jgi:hypothetical protein
MREIKTLSDIYLLSQSIASIGDFPLNATITIQNDSILEEIQELNRSLHTYGDLGGIMKSIHFKTPEMINIVVKEEYKYEEDTKE